MTKEEKMIILNARLAKLNARDINLKSPGCKRKLERKIRSLARA